MEEQECLCDDRLNSLKDKLFLSEKIFKRVSENMHFEIFKYLSAEILLEIRITCLGGYQLCANKNLRNKMVKNYYRKLQINAQEYKKSSKEWNIRKARVIHEQTSSNLGMYIYIYIFIYIYRNKHNWIMEHNIPRTLEMGA